MAEGMKRLVRPQGDRKIAGVCSGIADYFDVDVTFVRLAWIILSIVPGAIVAGVIAYIAAWLVMPEGASEPRSVMNPQKRLTRSVTDRKIAGVCGGLADYFGIDATALRVLWIVLSILPGAIIGGILMYVAAVVVMPKAQAPIATATPASVQPA